MSCFKKSQWVFCDKIVSSKHLVTCELCRSGKCISLMLSSGATTLHQSQGNTSGVSSAAAFNTSLCCCGCRYTGMSLLKGERGSVCAAHRRTCSHPGDTKAAAKPREPNSDFCKPFKFLSLRPWTAPPSIHLLIPLLFPRVSRQLKRLSEAATCTLAWRCSSKGT